MSKNFLLTVVYFSSAIIINIILKKILNSIVLKIKSTNKEKLIQKTQTLKSFLKSILTTVIFTIFGLLILDLWGVNIAPFLTGAGLIGLSISFGAQTLIKDIISGIFIIFEDQFNVGDYLKIGTLEGNVKKITLRQTILKDKKDNIIYIPNSQITSFIKFKKTNG